MKKNSQKIILTLALSFATLCIAKAQVSYTVDEANATKWQNFAHFELSSHLLGTTGMGFSIGAQSQYKLPVLPVTLAGRFRYEGFGVGDVLYKGETYGPSRNFELAAMIPILPGRKKPGKVKVTTNYEVSNTSTYEEYFYAEGEKKNELMARGGLFQYWTKGNFTSTGVSAGLTLRMRKHVDVSLSNEEGYHREVFSNNQLYFDLLYAPIIKGIREDEGYNLGGRIGFLRAASSGMNYYTELEVRPGFIAALTFGWLFGWERL
ncbi:MAG: hypothetical protein JXR10_03270 [Cyclobacteriaceae bacterium]